MAHEVAKTVKPMDKLKAALNVDSVKIQFQNALKDNAGPFIASIIDLYGLDQYLQQCDPNQVIMEALKAATLKLPINKQLGFAYIVPYKNRNGQQIPQFQLGYKGYIQLAMRTAQYRYLNAGIVCEGVKVTQELLTGEVAFAGEPISQKAQGYFAHMQLLNGFTKTEYMTREQVLAHAKRYSKSWGRDSSAWTTNFDEMAMKTVTRRLLGHFGILSTDMVTALTSTHEEEDTETAVEREIAEQANGQVIDVMPTEVADVPRQVDQLIANTGEPEQMAMMEEPGF